MSDLVMLRWRNTHTGESGCREPMPRVEAERLIHALLDVAWPHGFDYGLTPVPLVVE